MQEIIDTLEKGGCGVPLAHDPLWSCFLSDGHNTNQINQIGMDSAKLHCCHKAQSEKCRRLCTQTFSNDWFETHRDFEIDCYSQLNEVSLKQCLDEGNLFVFSTRHIAFCKVLYQQTGPSISSKQLMSPASLAAMAFRFVQTSIIDQPNYSGAAT